MPYKLKPNMADFEMVDGPFAGRKFEAGKTYEDVPLTEAHRFVDQESRAQWVKGPRENKPEILKSSSKAPEKPEKLEKPKSGGK